MTTAQVIRSFKRHNPATLQDIVHTCKLPVRYMNSGAFRHTYQMGSLPLVVKVPYSDEYDGCSLTEKKRLLMTSIEHANHEMRALRRILKSKKCAQLHSYMPKVYYFNRKTGVMLMHQYKVPTRYSEKHSNVCDRLDTECGDVLKQTGWFSSEVDFHNENVGYGAKQNPIILDLGLFEKY